MKILNYDKDPSMNSDAPPNGAPEGMAADQYNNTLRQLMTNLKEFVDNTQPQNITAGTGSAYTVSIGLAISAPIENVLYAIKFHATCDASPTLRFNGVSPTLTIQGHNGDALVAGAIEANSIHLGHRVGSNFRVITLDEYHEIRRGTRKLGITSTNSLEFADGSDVKAKITASGAIELDGGGTFGGGGTFSGGGTFGGNSKVTGDLAVVGDINASGDISGKDSAISSDERDKTDISKLDSDKLANLLSYIEPVSFTRIDAKKTSAKQFGFIAQQLETVEPSLVVPIRNNEGKTRLYVRHMGLTSILIGAVQELQHKIRMLENG